MGCVHHYIAKPNLSTFYLQKALVEEEEAMKTLMAESGMDVPESFDLFQYQSSLLTINSLL